tara:strand:+ start:199 stop:417 length:219 start_codon:yes stop_codon:yes gene_type:complete
VHDLVYHGGGGFIHSEVYNMPTWLRRFHIQKINEHVKKENDEIDKAQKGQSKPSDVARGPNITPSSNYNFKK